MSDYNSSELVNITDDEIFERLSQHHNAQPELDTCWWDLPPNERVEEELRKLGFTNQKSIGRDSRRFHP